MRLLVTIAFVGACLLLGALVALAPLPGAVLTGGLSMLLLLFVVSTRLALWATVVVCFLVVGPAESLGRVPRVFWICYLLGLFLFAKALLVWAGRHRTPLRSGGGFNDLNVNVLLFWLLLPIVFLFGSISQTPDLLEFTLGSRDYIWLWGFAALVLAGAISAEEQSRWFKFLLWLAIVQVPLVVYQHFFVIRGSRYATHDAVVGLFGGNPEGGGASGAMGFFSLLMALYAIGRLQSRDASRMFCAAVVVGALVSIALAEVKFVAIAAPFLALAYFGWRQVFTSPKSIAWLVVFTISAPAILYGYWQTFEAPGAKGYGSFARYVALIVERNTDTRHIDPYSGEMGRIAALRFWKDQNHFDQEPLTVAFGHGVGASRIGVFPGHVAQRYSFRIARSSLSVLLWELGVVGAGFVVVLLLVGWHSAVQLSGRIGGTEPEMRALARLVAAVFVAALIGMPYNTDLIGTPQFQLLVIAAVAWLISARRQFASPSTQRKRPLTWTALARSS